MKITIFAIAPALAEVLSDFTEERGSILADTGKRASVASAASRLDNDAA